MKTKFAQLEVLVTSMATHVNSNAFRLRRMKEQENISSSSSNANLRYFCKAKFSSLGALNEVMLGVVGDYDVGTNLKFPR
jgi:hypothetical protein